jgi:hypothetical protein
MNNTEKFRKLIKEAVNSLYVPKGKVNIDFINNNIIPKILKGELTNWTFDFANSRNKIEDFNYILTKLANLYRQGKYKEIVSDYIFYSLVPKGNMSSFLNLIGKNAGIKNILELSKEDEVFDILLDAVTLAIPNALDKFEPMRKNDFFSFIKLVSASFAKNGMIKYYKIIGKDKEDYNNEEGDYIIKTNDDDNSSALNHSENEEINSSDTEKLVGAVDNFIRKKILSGKSELWLKVYEMTVAGYNMEQMSDELRKYIGGSSKGLTNPTGFIRTTRRRLSDVIEQSIKNGELADYVLKETGLNINKFPKIKEIMKGGKFIFATPSQIIKEDLQKIISGFIKEAFEDLRTTESKEFLDKVKQENPEQIVRFLSLIKNKGLEIAKEKYIEIDPEVLKQKKVELSKEKAKESRKDWYERNKERIKKQRAEKKKESEEQEILSRINQIELIREFVAFLPNEFPEQVKKLIGKYTNSFDSAYYMLLGAYTKKFEEKTGKYIDLYGDSFDEDIFEEMMYGKFGEEIEF